MHDPPGRDAQGARLPRIALDVRDWVARRVEEGGLLDPARTLLYTYWFDGTALGAALAKRDFPEIRCVSRAHGYDLYAERYTPPPYMPFEETRTCSPPDRIYPPVSEHGKRYLSARHPPSCASGFRVARLGTGDPGFLTPPPPSTGSFGSSPVPTSFR